MGRLWCAAEAQIKIGSLEAWGASFLAQAALPGMEFGNKTKLVLLGNITAPRQENTRMGKLSAAVCCGVELFSFYGTRTYIPFRRTRPVNYGGIRLLCF